MAKYHVKKDGTPGACRAQQGNCPLGGIEDHFESVQQVQQYADRLNESEIVLNKVLSVNLRGETLEQANQKVADKIKKDYLNFIKTGYYSDTSRNIEYAYDEINKYEHTTLDSFNYFNENLDTAEDKYDVTTPYNDFQKLEIYPELINDLDQRLQTTHFLDEHILSKGEYSDDNGDVEIHGGSGFVNYNIKDREFTVYEKQDIESDTELREDYKNSILTKEFLKKHLEYCNKNAKVNSEYLDHELTYKNLKRKLEDSKTKEERRNLLYQITHIYKN